MTYRELVKKEHPERISDWYEGGVYGCPSESVPDARDLCERGHCKGGVEKCTRCWDQEISDNPTPGAGVRGADDGRRAAMTHKIKIHENFADAVLFGEKTFEVRNNDRGYQKGDFVQFQVIDPRTNCDMDHPLNSKTYRITYVLSGWGIQMGYVAFSIQEVPYDTPY